MRGYDPAIRGGVRPWALLLAVLTGWLPLPSPATAADFSGRLGAETRLFSAQPLYPGQERHDASVFLEPEYYAWWSDSLRFSLIPFLRLDNGDGERTHFDLRELQLLWVNRAWELRAGVGRVFWGVTEFVHLIDIVNQTDLVEDPDGEEKLGQPLVQLTIPHGVGGLDLFLLPGFRERTFPGRSGRLRPRFPIESDQARYESAAGEHHLDFAARYTRTLGSWDLGLACFSGTGREPELRPALSGAGRPVLAPYYPRIGQASLDIQGVAGSWLIKLEALRRTGQGEAFSAATGGFEYTLYGLGDTAMDLGIIGEWAWDERGERATTPYQNEAMFGLRLAANDPGGGRILAGLLQDLDNGSRLVRLEASRRFGRHLRITVEALALAGQEPDEPTYPLRRDDFARLIAAWYY